MAKHRIGKHRLIKERTIAARVGMNTAVVALGLTAALVASPIASAAPASTDVALQAYTVSTAPAPHHDDHHADGDRNRRGPIHFRGPVRRGHWENTCRDVRGGWDRSHNRWFVRHLCDRRVWRNW